MPQSALQTIGAGALIGGVLGAIAFGIVRIVALRSLFWITEMVKSANPGAWTGAQLG